MQSAAAQGVNTLKTSLGGGGGGGGQQRGGGGGQQGATAQGVNTLSTALIISATPAHPLIPAYNLAVFSLYFPT